VAQRQGLRRLVIQVVAALSDTIFFIKPRLFRSTLKTNIAVAWDNLCLS